MFSEDAVNVIHLFYLPAVQGSSMSAFWYSLFDNGTNYCNLRNVIQGGCWGGFIKLHFSSTPSLSEDLLIPICSDSVSCLYRKWTQQRSGLRGVHQRVALPRIWTLCLQIIQMSDLCFGTCFFFFLKHFCAVLKIKRIDLLSESWKHFEALTRLLWIIISVSIYDGIYNNINMWSWPIVNKCSLDNNRISWFITQLSTQWITTNQ